MSVSIRHSGAPLHSLKSILRTASPAITGTATSPTRRTIKLLETNWLDDFKELALARGSPVAVTRHLSQMLAGAGGVWLSGAATRSMASAQRELTTYASNFSYPAPDAGATARELSILLIPPSGTLGNSDREILRRLLHASPMFAAGKLTEETWLDIAIPWLAASSAKQQMDVRSIGAVSVRPGSEYATKTLLEVSTLLRKRRDEPVADGLSFFARISWLDPKGS